MKAKVFIGYGDEKKEAGTIEVIGNKLVISIEDKDLKDVLSSSPYDLLTEGKEAYDFLIGRFMFSSTIMFKESH